MFPVSTEPLDARRRGNRRIHDANLVSLLPVGLASFTGSLPGFFIALLLV